MHFHPDSWYVITDPDGHIYVSDPAQDYVAEFDTEDEAWNYINKCREHGIDFNWAHIVEVDNEESK